MSLVASTSNHLHVRSNMDGHVENLINVFLRMWDGRTLCCMVDANRASILWMGCLEQKVLDNYPRYDKGAFFFEFDGKPLSTKSSFQPRLVDGSTVFVQYRNRGGCFVVSFTLMMTIFALILSSTCTCGASLLFVPLLLPLLFVLPLFCL